MSDDDQPKRRMLRSDNGRDFYIDDDAFARKLAAATMLPPSMLYPRGRVDGDAFVRFIRAKQWRMTARRRFLRQRLCSP